VSVLLDETEDQFAHPGTRPWAIYFVNQAQTTRYELEQRAESLRDLILILKKNEAWKPLGISSFEVLCRNKIKLEMNQVDAIMASKRGETIGTVLSKTEAIRARRAEHPEETQQATADAVGCAQSMVATIINKSSDSEESLIIPNWIRGHDEQVSFRRLPSSEQQRLIDLPPDQRRGAVRRAAINAGIIRLPTPLEQAQKAFEKLDSQDRLAFVEWIGQQSQPQPTEGD